MRRDTSILQSELPLREEQRNGRVDLLHVVPAYHPARGGVEVLVENLAEGLRDGYGITSAVLAPALPGERPSDYVHRGTRVYSVPVRTEMMAPAQDQQPTPPTPQETLQVMTGVYSAIRQVCWASKPRILHVHAASLLAPGAVSIAMSQSIPVVMHVHGTIHAWDPPNFRGRVRDATWVCAVADAVANSIRLDCERTGPITVLRNGVVDPLRTTLPSGSSSPSVAMVGRLSPEKGFDDGLRALALARRQLPDLRVRLVGSGPMTNGLHRVAREVGLVDSVDYFGQLENADTLRVIAGSDVVLIPSREEGFSLVAVEAALLERPVVATAVGGLPETVIDGVTGILVAAGDLGAMARAVTGLLLDRYEALRLGQQARARALTEFAMDRFVGELAELYATIWAPTNNLDQPQ